MNDQTKFSEETERKFALMTQNLQEVINGNYIKQLFEEGKEPSGYWGTASTGAIHVGYLLCFSKIRDCIQAGTNMTILIADIHAFLDDLKCPFDK